ncbi:MAG: hypothetical protein NTU62_13795, partial [Spirochaetes bacterium]|nr:hypothetical protein [Spirochaetota bacterium]
IAAVTGATFNLDLRAGTAGTISGTSTVGVGTLTITSSNGSTFSGAVGAATLALAGSQAGAILAFQGNVTLTTALTTAAVGYAVSFTGAANTIPGNTTFSNTGGVTFGDGADITTFSTGTLTSTASTTTLNGTVRTAAQTLTLGAVTLAGNSTLDTTNNGGAGAGNTLTIGAVTGATFNLALRAGTAGTISGTSTVGVGTLTITSSNGSTFSGAVGAATLALAGSQAGAILAFQGNVTLTTALTTAAVGYAVSLTGAANSIAGNTTFSNTGGVTFGDGGDITTFSTGTLTSTAGTTTLNGTIYTLAQTLTLGAVTLAGSSVLDSTNAGGSPAGANVAIQSGLADAGFKVDINSGAGTILVNGGGAPLLNLRAGTLTTNNNTVAAVTIRNATTVALGNVSAIGGAIATLVLGVLSDISGAVTQNLLTVLNVSRLTTSTASDITLTQLNTVTDLRLVDRGGSFTLVDSGGLTVTGPVNAGGLVDPVTISTSGGLLQVSGAVTATDNPITLSGVGVTFAAGITVNPGSGTLSINADTGALTTGANTMLLNNLGIVSIIADGAALTGTSQIGGTGAGAGNAATVTIEPKTVAQTIGLAGGAGVLALTAAELATIRSTNVRIGLPTGTGAMTIGAWTPPAAFATGVLTLYANGDITQTGVINLATSGSDLLLRGTGNVTLTLGNRFGTVAASKAAGGSVSLTNGATFPMTVGSLTDDIGGPVDGITALGAVTLACSGAGGSLTLNQAVSTTNSPISLTGTGVTQALVATVNPGNSTILVNGGGGAINLNGLLTTTNATPAAVTIRTASTAALGNISASGLGASVTIGVGQDITGAVTQNALTTISAFTLTLSTNSTIALSNGGNAITILGAVARSGAFTLLDSTLGLLVTGPVNAGTANDDVSISTTGGNLTVNGAITASSGSPAVVLAANVLQNVILNAVTVTAANGSITINDPLILGGLGASTLTTLAGGPVAIGNIVNGPQALAITAGTGDVTLSGIVGGVTALASLTISGATIDVQAVTTTGLQSYTGATILNGNLTSNTSGDITLTGSVTLAAAALRIQSAAGVGEDIIFNSTIDGAQDLLLAAGLGDITMTGIVGGTTPPLSISFLSAATLTATTIDANRIHFEAGMSIAAGVPVIWNADIHIFAPGATITFNRDLTCRNFVLYAGQINLAGNDLATTQDLVLLGRKAAVYTDDDPETLTADVFKYDAPARTGGSLAGKLANPNVGLLPLFPSGTAIVENNYNGDFVGAGLAGSTVTVGGNFYTNGCDLAGTAAWTLNLPANDSAAASFAEAYNMTVAFCTAVGGTVAASTQAPGENVTDGGNNTGWAFTRPSIFSAGTYTVSDNVIRVEFTAPIENSNGEIRDTIDGTLNRLFGDAGAPYTGTFTDAACTTTTDGAGDLSWFFIQINTTTWNTNADGTNSGGLEVRNTDRSGNHRSVLPLITYVKDSLTIYFSFRDADKNRLATENYTGVTDRCKPVLYKVDTGTAPTSALGLTAATRYDGHNYFALYYSESVTIGNLLVGDANKQSQATFNAGEHGGFLTSATGTATLAGYFSYPYPVSDLAIGATAGYNAAEMNALYRPDAWKLTLYIVGYEANGAQPYYWPGYIEWDTVDPLLADPADANPNGRTATIAANGEIKDAAGTPVDGTTVALGDGTVAMDWDTDPPYFARYDPVTKEGVLIDSDGGGYIDRVEFHALDDTRTDDLSWDPNFDHPDLKKGIRDTTYDHLLDTENNRLAFQFKNTVIPITDLYNEAAPYETNVDNELFTQRLLEDDTYFSFKLVDGWFEAALPMEATYDKNIAHITDLAGNLMPSVPPGTSIAATERISPYINYSLSVVSQDKVWITFSEPVYGDRYPANEAIAAVDFKNLLGLPVSSLVIVESAQPPFDPAGAISVILTLGANITADQAVSEIISATFKKGDAGLLDNNGIFDRSGNAMQRDHRITDVGLGVFDPVWATDGVHRDGTFAYLGESLRVFDGTGKLMDRDITLEISLLAASQTNVPSRLFYDVDPGAVLVSNGLWLPVLIPGLTPRANTEARSLLPLSGFETGLVRDFTVPASDPEMTNGSDLEMILKLGDLYCARVVRPFVGNSPPQVEPWVIQIRDLERQKGGVTILNNVINPSAGDRVAVSYIIPKSGTVTVQVFDLAGDLVTVLFRGSRTAGEHMLMWDGRNSAGRIVAPGVYFIKVVGPEVAEVRKVLVTK